MRMHADFTTCQLIVLTLLMLARSVGVKDSPDDEEEEKDEVRMH